MTKNSPKNSSNVTMSVMRRTALMGAAATALIAVTPNLYSGAHAATVTVEAAGPQAAAKPEAVKDLLAVPMSASTLSASIVGTEAVVITNTDVIDGGDGTGITGEGDQGDLTISNSGDVSGVNGIIANTANLGATRDNATYYGHTETTDYDFASAAYVYDADGNVVLNPYSWGGYFFKSEIRTNRDIFNKDADASDANLVVDNSGSVSFTGLYGVKATNESGDSIQITNTGDITSTADTERRVGIYADSTAQYVKYTDKVLTTAGDFTYDDQGRLLEGFTPNLYDETTSIIRMSKDDGVVRIENAGTIDMGTVLRTDPFDHIGYAASEGITAISNGGIEIVNSGSLKVGDFSTGITAIGDGSISIENSGTLEIGNKSTGITISDSGLYGYQIGDHYRASGDNLILNTGDIIGGMTHEEAAASDNAYAFSIGSSVEGFWEATYVVGIRADVRNTNNEYYARYEQFKEEQAYYAGIFGEEYFPAHNFPNVKNDTTTIRNEGNILLKDGGRGIVGSAQYGALKVINSGTISVGDGTPKFDSNADVMSGGIMLSNFMNNGLGDLYAKNEEGGVIVTGDDSVGMQAQNWVGNNATVINEGSLTVGNGVVGIDYIANPDYTGNYPYDRVFKSIGMEGVNRGASQAFVYMRNSGDLTTGDLTLGMRMYANSSDLYLVGRSAGLALNEGTITTGDNSIGIQASGGTSFVVHNTGTITIGDKDISGFNTNRFTKGSFELSGAGIWASAGLAGYVVNEGTVNTGNGTIGIAHVSAQNPYDFNYFTYTAQGVDGIVSTGDNAIGIKTHSGRYNYTNNAGQVSVGENSVGIEASAGFHYSTEVETIIYGGCNKVTYNGGAGCDANTITTGYTYDYSGTVDWSNFVSGTRTEIIQEVSQPGVASVTNSGIIETGDNSVGVRMAGVTGLDYKQYRYVSTPNSYGGRYNKRTPVYGTVDTNSYVFFKNTGTISVGENSTGVEITGRGVSDGYGNYAQQMINYGTIIAPNSGAAIKINTADLFGAGVTGGKVTTQAAPAIDSVIVNVGTISGDILFGDGNDTLINTQYRDANNVLISQGNLVMNGNTIDFGAGANTLDMDYGLITVAGGDNLITGANVVMTYGQIDAINNAATSTLTIDGNVSGDFRFGADISNDGADQLIVTGDVASGSSIGVILNPTEQLTGNVNLNVITVEGTNAGSTPILVDVQGIFADSLQDATFETDANGNTSVNATFGMGHMATATTAATTMLQNWWLQSVASFDKRNGQWLAGRKQDGLSIWGSAFHDEGTINPTNAFQDVGFDEQVTGVQTGLTFTKEIGSAAFAIGPNFAWGKGQANLNANTASASTDGWSYGINASVLFQNGLYLDAAWQKVKMDVDFMTPDTFSQATGKSKANGDGFNVEAGYAHKLKSGLTLAPQVQYSTVDIDLNDFSSSDGVYSFTDIGGKSSTLRAGMSVFKNFETNDGSITPMIGLSYVNAMDGDSMLKSNGVGFGTDASGSGYKAELGVSGTFKAWDLGVRVGVTDTSATKQMLSTNLTVRYRW